MADQQKPKKQPQPQQSRRHKTSKGGRKRAGEAREVRKAFRAAREGRTPRGEARRLRRRNLHYSKAQGDDNTEK